MAKKRKIEVQASEGRMEAANALSPTTFIQKYLPEYELPKEYKTSAGDEYLIDLVHYKDLTEEDFKACFQLIEHTSGDDYRKSSWGWRRKWKEKEMRDDELRYVLVKRNPEATADSADTPEVEAFMSFMLTYEDGQEVIYCYEVHLQEHLRGCGLGRRLMEFLELVGCNVGVRKCMLTCFNSNKRAMSFYRRLGYDEDEGSPQPKRLRSGVVKKPDYMIMSKSLSS